jgi:hypothetical protein
VVALGRYKTSPYQNYFVKVQTNCAALTKVHKGIVAHEEGFTPAAYFISFTDQSTL